MLSLFCKYRNLRHWKTTCRRAEEGQVTEKWSGKWGFTSPDSPAPPNRAGFSPCEAAERTVSSDSAWGGNSNNKNPLVHSVFKVGCCGTICFTTQSWQNKFKTLLCTCLHVQQLASAAGLKVCLKSLMLFVTFSNSLLSSRWQEIQVCLPPGRSLFTDKSKTLDKRQPRELVDLLAVWLTSVQVLFLDKTRNSI